MVMFVVCVSFFKKVMIEVVVVVFKFDVGSSRNNIDGEFTRAMASDKRRF